MHAPENEWRILVRTNFIFIFEFEQINNNVQFVSHSIAIKCSNEIIQEFSSNICYRNTTIGEKNLFSSIFVQPSGINKSNCFIASIKLKRQLMNLLQIKM